MMQNIKSKVILFVIITMAIFSFCTTKSFGLGENFSGTINVSARSNADFANTNKLLKISFFSAGTTENPSFSKTLETNKTNISKLPFSINLNPGTYDMTVEKLGYLKYTMKNIVIRENSSILIPEINLIAGDINSDNFVNIADLALMLRSFDKALGFADVQIYADLNEDGINNASDLGILKSKNNFSKNSVENATVEYDKSYDSGLAFENAEYYIDVLSFAQGPNTLTSGWNYDNSYQIMNCEGSQTYLINDKSSETEINVNRTFTAKNSGVLTFDLIIEYSYVGEGSFISFTNENKTEALQIYSLGGKYYFKGQTDVVLTAKPTYGQQKFRIIMNLDERSAKVVIDGIYQGEFAMAKNSEELSRVIIGASKVGITSFSPVLCQMYSNYFVNEVFLMNPPNVLPYDWTFAGNHTMSAKNGNGATDNYSILISAAQNTKNEAKKTFNEIYGNVVFETYLLLEKGESGAYVSLNLGEKSGVRVETLGNNFVFGKTQLRKYTDNIWQCIRIEANTNTGKALIRIDGKKVGEYDILNTLKSFDNITIGFNPTNSAQMFFDDVKVSVYTEPVDYVPQPISAQTDDYYIGVNVCSLWRNGNHSGWDCVSPYPDLEPVLGFYDEGVPELADWEIKMMVEHGIDYQHFCWYCPSGNIDFPIKKSRMNDALHDGFFNAKYSDMMKFNFMWENSGTNVYSLSQFKEYIWSYWKEYYFSDTRFMTMDNKIVFTVWSLDRYINAFGGETNALAATNFMNEDLKTLGYDGLILLFADGHSMSKFTFEKMKRVGASGSYGYHWNVDGKYAEHQIYRMSTQLGYGQLHVVPTISVGFNNTAWSGVRKGIIDLAGHEQVANYIKNTHLKTYNQNTWEGKALIVSTWNEYGEGTYVMPAGVNAYGYLDTIRKVFTNAGEETHNDLIPTQNQRARINNLFPNDRSIIRRIQLDYDKDIIPNTIMKSWSGVALQNWMNLFNVANLQLSNENLIGSLTKIDGGLYLNEKFSFLANSVTSIHIRMKSDVNTTMQIMFQTSEDPTWNQAKSISKDITNINGFVDYYIDLQGLATWNETITALRFDPLNAVGNFEISKIDLCGYSDEQIAPKLIINGKKIVYDFFPKFNSNEVYVAVNPMQGTLSLLNLYYEFSRFSGKLKLADKNHEIIFTQGENYAIFDGSKIDLDMPFSIRDGLPIVPMIKLSQLFGFNYSYLNKTLEIKTFPDSIIDGLTKRVKNEYEFNLDGDLEGWYGLNADIYCDGEALVGISKNNDPIITIGSQNINSQKYKQIKLSQKHSAKNATNIQIFFLTDNDSSWNEEKSVRIKTAQSSQEYIEYIVDMSKNPLWNGTITAIRIDPISNSGTFSINYIKCLIDPNYVDNLIIDPKAPATLVNANAQGNYHFFYSGNADISIVASENPYSVEQNNNVFYVNPKTANGYIYFRQPILFKNEKTYIVEFDAKVVEAVDGTALDSVRLHLNFVYLDANMALDHVVGAWSIKPSDGWQHFTQEVKVENSFDRTQDVFAIYTNPSNDKSVRYMLDNLTIKEK